MGATLNPSGDLVPAAAFYDACRVVAQGVDHVEGVSWSFGRAIEMPIPKSFKDHTATYLRSVVDHRHSRPDALVGWKLPETTLAYPWIRRLFPDMHYIFLVRDPRDCILGAHVTDDLGTFGIRYPSTEDVLLRRAISWKYHYDIVAAVPPPERSILVRFEDFVNNQEETLLRLEAFFGDSFGEDPDAFRVYRSVEAARGTLLRVSAARHGRGRLSVTGSGAHRPRAHERSTHRGSRRSRVKSPTVPTVEASRARSRSTVPLCR